MAAKTTKKVVDLLPKSGPQTVIIPPPDLRTVAFQLIGTAPFVQLRRRGRHG